jgi:hypothetical protein
MTMNKSERDIYQAYLLRIWREGSSSPWRAMLESTHTGNHHNFAAIEQLISFLLTQTGETGDIYLSTDPIRPRSK